MENKSCIYDDVSRVAMLESVNDMLHGMQYLMNNWPMSEKIKVRIIFTLLDDIIYYANNAE